MKTVDEFFFEHKMALAFMVNGIPTRDFSFPSVDDEDDDCYSIYTYDDNCKKYEFYISHSDKAEVIGEKTIQVSYCGEVIEITALY